MATPVACIEPMSQFTEVMTSDMSKQTMRISMLMH
jgi:hypothetical protein